MSKDTNHLVIDFFFLPPIYLLWWCVGSIVMGSVGSVEFLHFVELSSVGGLYFIPKCIWKNLTKNSFTKPAADFTLAMLLKLLTILFVKGNMRKHFRITTENTNLPPGTDKFSLVSKRHNWEIFIFHDPATCFYLFAFCNDKVRRVKSSYVLMLEVSHETIHAKTLSRVLDI